MFYINRDYRSVKTNCIYWLRVLIILLRKRGNLRLSLVPLKLLVEETGVPRENHIPAASSQWLILSRLLITSLVSSVYGFWLPLWYLRCTDYDYLFGIFGVRILITSLVSSVYGFWLPLWYLRCTDSDYLFGIFGVRILITSLVFSVYGFWLPLWYLRCTDSDYLIGIFGVRFLITSLVSSVYGFWLPLWYLRCTDSDYLFGIFGVRILITSLVSSNLTWRRSYRLLSWLGTDTLITRS